MRKAIVKYNNIEAGILSETENGEYHFSYSESYIQEYPKQFITFHMPVINHTYRSNTLFPFFNGLIPEGWLLNIASKGWKIDKNDRMGLLLACCKNAIGAVSIHPLNNNEHE